LLWKSFIEIFKSRILLNTFTYITSAFTTTAFSSTPTQVNNSSMKPLRERIHNSMQEKNNKDSFPLYSLLGLQHRV